MTGDDLVVIRLHEQIRRDFPQLARYLHGRWIVMPPPFAGPEPDGSPWGKWKAVRTDRYEVRPDGVRARVYEVRP